jgi:hypothetical protein
MAAGFRHYLFDVADLVCLPIESQAQQFLEQGILRFALGSLDECLIADGLRVVGLLSFLPRQRCTLSAAPMRGEQRVGSDSVAT